MHLSRVKRSLILPHHTAPSSCSRGNTCFKLKELHAHTKICLGSNFRRSGVQDAPSPQERLRDTTSLSDSDGFDDAHLNAQRFPITRPIFPPLSLFPFLFLLSLSLPRLSQGSGWLLPFDPPTRTSALRGRGAFRVAGDDTGDSGPRPPSSAFRVFAVVSGVACVSSTSETPVRPLSSSSSESGNERLRAGGASPSEGRNFFWERTDAKAFASLSSRPWSFPCASRGGLAASGVA